MHIIGEVDNEVIKSVNVHNIELLLALELIDYTVSEYVRDSAMLGMPKAILAVVHFNLEEAGIAYMPDYITKAIQADIPVQFINKK